MSKHIILKNPRAGDFPYFLLHVKKNYLLIITILSKYKSEEIQFRNQGIADIPAISAHLTV